MSSAGQKRQAAGPAKGEAPSKGKQATKALVNPKRVRDLRPGAVGPGPVIYWCAPASPSSPDHTPAPLLLRWP